MNEVNKFVTIRLSDALICSINSQIDQQVDISTQYKIIQIRNELRKVFHPLYMALFIPKNSMGKT